VGGNTVAANPFLAAWIAAIAVDLISLFFAFHASIIRNFAFG
jgi:hypothetical protein